VLARHGGTEVKSQGDGFMLTFSSARRAVSFMVETQRALHVDQIGLRGLRIRIGAHTGEALETADGDLFGRAVIMAARVGAAAAGGEVLVSSLVREIVESWGDITFADERLVELKGLGGRHVLHPVVWQEEPIAGA
jgi:class 3 adenylate cyclase